MEQIERFPELVVPNPTLTAAIYRYEKCWLPLVRESAGLPLFPPLDVAWIWVCHRFSSIVSFIDLSNSRMTPLNYLQDCDTLCGGVLDFKLPADLNEAIRLTQAIVQKNILCQINVLQVAWRDKFPGIPFETNSSWNVPEEFSPSLSCNIFAVSSSFPFEMLKGAISIHDVCRLSAN